MPHHPFATKSLARLAEEMGREQRLLRVLGLWQLTALGVGAVIGAGIFVSTGKAAHETAGPALTLSYVVAAAVCALAGLCYAEFASMVPAAGSVYTYAYATLGELVAWIIGWDLALEYAVGSAAVANGWSAYFQSVLASLGLHLPTAWSGPVVTLDPATGHYVLTGSLLNLPALLVVLAMTALLVRGIRESANANVVMVALKVGIVVMVILVGAFFVDPARWSPFAPYGYGGMTLFGRPFAGAADAAGRPVGVLAGAAIAFFSYIGFDSISTHAEEARRPQRDVPRALLLSLGLCTVLYVAVTAVLTGMVPYDRLAAGDPVADAFRQVGMPRIKAFIAVGAVAGITSVLLVMMLSQSRVLLAIARDGLLPRGFFGAVHPRFRTPWKATLSTGAFTAVLAALLPMDLLINLVNMGTLLAFAIVCGAVMVLRRTNPEAPRPFRAPGVPLLPILGIAGCVVLMLSLPAVNWLRLVVWLAIGLAIYVGYGRRHSVLATDVEISRSGS
ncbi:MAG TPA: amino acid permease [Candidatus Polarisedimenticolia bacterium]|nr:amino acid permease [Candidatus Polarisedimenticolia bacterium]